MKWLFDIKYAYRMLLKNPGFTGLTVSVMAAGLGLCVFMLAFISSIALRPLPFVDGEQMFMIDTEYDGIQYNGGNIELHDYQEIRERSQSYSMMGAFYNKTANLSNGERAERYTGVATEINMFAYTSTEPAMGRAFTQEDALPGSEPVVIISDEVWQQYFNGESNILDRQVKINGETNRIVGVMPKGYKFPSAGQIWFPMKEDASRDARGETPALAIYVKKHPHVSLEQAEAEVRAIMADLAQRFPETNAKVSAHINTFQKNMMGNGSDMILGMMITAVTFILVLACVNVGNLLLARANERAKETAIRVALGAPKGRLIMQMMWESVFICALGGLFGIFMAAWGLELMNSVLPQMMPISTPFWWIMSLDSELIWQSLLIMVLTAFVTGIIPAWKMTRSDFNAVLRDGTRGAQGKRAGRINQLLVVIEVALSCILLTLSGVLFVVLQEVNNIDYGANTEHKLKARVGLPEITYPETEDRHQYAQKLIQNLEAIPGVNHAGIMTSLPGQGSWYQSFQPEGFEVVNEQFPRTGHVIASIGSLKALEMPLLEGRYFDSRDRADSLPVSVITESMANKYWPGESALGKRFKFVGNEDSDWYTVVGVVAHVIHGQPYSMIKNRTTAYRPLSQSSDRFFNPFIDVSGNADDYREAFLNAIAKTDSDVPPYNLRSLEEDIRRNTGGMVFIRDLFGIFALCALLLASSGIYGVLSNSTARKTQEIGIRRAIGASDDKVLKMLMKQGWWQLAIGIIIGLPIGYLGSRGMIQLVGPESNSYLWVYLVIPTVIALVVSCATYFPARRAIKLEPSVALRYE